MSSTYSESLRIELIGTGDQAGAWGTTTDNNFAYIFDKAIAGYLDVDITTSPHTLTSVSGPTSSSALNQSVYAALRFINATGAATVYAPAVPKTYIIWNNSGYAVTLYNTGYSTGPTIADGAKVLVFSNGTAFYEVSPQTVNGVVPVTKGGTGATTASGARTNLGLGTMATQDASAVAITGGTVNGAVIGGSSPAAGTFTTASDSKGNVRTITQNPQTGSYTLVAADAGKHVSTTAGVIIPASIFATGEAITIYNNSASSITITSSAVTAYIAGANTVVTSATLVARGICTVLFYGSNACVISGTL
jgi:hypothetical protein